MTRIFRVIATLFIVGACHQHSPDHTEDFDAPLITKNRELAFSGQYDAAIHLNLEYFKMAKKENYEGGEGLCYINIANINLFAGDYEKARLFFKKAAPKIDLSKDPYHKAKFYYDYGRYYAQLRQYDNALVYSNKALGYIKEAKDSELKKRLYAQIYGSSGTYYAFKGWKGTAEKNLLKSITINNTIYNNSMVAQFYLLTHQLNAAEKYVLKIEDRMRHERTSNVESAWIYYTIGYYYNEKGQYDLAEMYLKKALELNIKTRRINSPYVRNIYEALATLYQKKNNYDKAYYYLNKFNREEEILEYARMQTLNKATEDFEMKMKQESDKRRNNFWITGILSLITLSAAGIYVRNIIKKLQLRKEILKNEAEELKSTVKTKKQQEILELAKNNDSTFLLKFKELYPDFIRKLLEINPDLENSELAFCAMLKLHFSSKEIADYTFVQHKSIQQKKYRIRKRLNIPKEDDIYEFIDDLV
ncbi:MAG: tetratricopeptide repeat protein [Chryseobacterium sp.]|uniref:tetratricopeptide repeat protein n=1 Tax=Chryseobacterium sp. TaxID=1871047 RepID=UPI002837B292|nr:tetratricopeptide repeat protein [Chryseobacterium sp.]MDR2234990.1 tetratricopeptide repeat protein [Chryseobacterium sp.]